jgi:PBP1b-binding outer membrane lipoprotein LpoB
MKKLSTILLLLVSAIVIVGCGDKAADKLDAKDIETDTSATAPVERSTGAADATTMEATPGPGSLTEEEAAARVGSATGN